MFLLSVVKTVWDNNHPTVASETFFSFQAFGDEDPRDGEQVGTGADDEGEVGHTDRQVRMINLWNVSDCIFFKG